MSDDVTIPAAAAKAAAELLRNHKDDIPTDTRFSPLSLADLLDPPVLSLRDEAMATARMFRYRQQTGYGVNTERIDYAMADEILAVVRKRIAALPQHSRVEDVRTEDMRHHVVAHLVVDRADLFALLGGESDE